MLLEPGLDLSLNTLIELDGGTASQAATVDAECRGAVLEFIFDRLRQLFAVQGYAAGRCNRYWQPGTCPADILRRLQSVHAFLGCPRRQPGGGQQAHR